MNYLAFDIQVVLDTYFDFTLDYYSKTFLEIIVAKLSFNYNYNLFES